MAEDFGTIYEADFGGKTVLDIGGCIGESAVYFARRGVPLYLIKAHSAELRQSLLDKFVASGFEVVKDWLCSKDTGRGQTLHILAFKRIDPNDLGAQWSRPRRDSQQARPARRQ